MDQRRALAFIFCTMTLDVLAFGLMIPVLPRLILDFMGGDIAGAAEVVGLFSTAWAAMQFFSSPAPGGLLAGLSPRLPFWASAAACLANAAFGWFVLPESLPPERRMAFDWKCANPIGAVRLHATHRELFGLAIRNFCGQVAHQVLPAVFVLYAGYRYGWNEIDVGLTLAFVGLLGRDAGPAGGAGRPVDRRALDHGGRPAARCRRDGDLRPCAGRRGVLDRRARDVALGGWAVRPRWG
jgi:hypothetical protein